MDLGGGAQLAQNGLLFAQRTVRPCGPPSYLFPIHVQNWCDWGTYPVQHRQLPRGPGHAEKEASKEGNHIKEQ